VTRPGCTFAVSDASGDWEVLKDEVSVGRFHSRGDAVRVACFRARAEDRRGRRSRVIARPGSLVIPHYEAHFGL